MIHNFLLQNHTLSDSDMFFWCGFPSIQLWFRQPPSDWRCGYGRGGHRHRGGHKTALWWHPPEQAVHLHDHEWSSAARHGYVCGCCWRTGKRFVVFDSFFLSLSPSLSVSFSRSHSLSLSCWRTGKRFVVSLTLSFSLSLSPSLSVSFSRSHSLSLSPAEEQVRGLGSLWLFVSLSLSFCVFLSLSLSPA